MKLNGGSDIAAPRGKGVQLHKADRMTLNQHKKYLKGTKRKLTRCLSVKVEMFVNDSRTGAPRCAV